MKTTQLCVLSVCTAQALRHGPAILHNVGVCLLLLTFAAALAHDSVAQTAAADAERSAGKQVGKPIATEHHKAHSSQTHNVQGVNHRSLSHLRKVLSDAQACLAKVCEEVQDYECTLIAQERIDGSLQPVKLLRAKVRHEKLLTNNVVVPPAVYLKFEAPGSLKGREVLFIDEGTDDDLLVRKGGRHLAFLTLTLDPDSPVAMQGNRYSIREFGLKQLLERMLKIGNHELEAGQCSWKTVAETQFDKRCCTMFQLEHSEPERSQPAMSQISEGAGSSDEDSQPALKTFDFHIARIYIDKELRLPIGFEAYGWPENEESRPPLLERYIYRDIKLNAGLSQDDFDPDTFLDRGR